jgi:hypothetical protein
MTLICTGMKNAQIGRELGVSAATIRLHIGNIHRKLATSSKVDLVLKLWQWCCANGRGTVACRWNCETCAPTSVVQDRQATGT